MPSYDFQPRNIIPTIFFSLSLPILRQNLHLHRAVFLVSRLTLSGPISKCSLLSTVRFQLLYKDLDLKMTVILVGIYTQI